MAHEAPCVLLVDDDPLVRRMIKTYLERRGVPILDAPSGDEAWQILSSQPSSIRLLITDLIMPGISGSELARKVRAAGYGFPIILISGYSGDVPEIGEDTDCMRKPLDLKVLAARITELTGVSTEMAARLCRAS